jgi:hypothetical protein
MHMLGRQRSAEAAVAAALLRADALGRDVGAARGEAARLRADAEQRVQAHRTAVAVAAERQRAAAQVGTPRSDGHSRCCYMSTWCRELVLDGRLIAA